MTHPLAKTLLQLALLRTHHYDRSTVLDLLGSPFYDQAQCDVRPSDWRPDLWSLLSQQLGIVKGEEQWRRLTEQARVVAESLDRSERDRDDEADEPRRPSPPRHQIGPFAAVVTRLLADCRALPADGSLARLTERFLYLVDRHLQLPDADDPVRRSVDTVFEQLRQLDRLEIDYRWDEWTALFQHLCERTVVPIEGADHLGVHVLDAMSARGLSFKALFVLGVNDKVFPRHVREDAFLRDRHRRVLDATMGYKIDEKLAGYEEEALLFELFCRSADRRLYLVSQRADDHGRPLAASSFLDQARRRFGLAPTGDERPPRSVAERFAASPDLAATAPLEDVILWHTLRNEDPSLLLAASGRSPEIFRYGRHAGQCLDVASDELGAGDGMTGPLEHIWMAQVAAGFSPSALESYARCPFQYFGRHILRLRPVREEANDELDALAVGSLCHATLRRCYDRLLPLGWPDSPDDAATRTILERAIEEVFAEAATEMPPPYPLLWEVTRERVRDLLREAIELDRAECLDSGFTPIACEVEATGSLTPLAESGATPLTIRGRLDRVDTRADPPGLRILDYKYTQGSAPAPDDLALPAAAVKGHRLQPPLYTLMTLPEHPAPTAVDFLFLAPRWTPVIQRARFERSFWDSPDGAQLVATLRTLLAGIREGRFFMLPGGYCDHCELHSACRLRHGPSWLRAYRSPEAAAHRRLRKQKIRHD